MPASQALAFKNEPLTDFSAPAPRQAMEAALRLVHEQVRAVYPLWIDGKRLKSRAVFKSFNPSHPAEVVGIVQNAGIQLADRALETAKNAFSSWSGTRAWKRAEVLRQMAKLLRARKLEFCAWLIYEVGKNWPEADADVAEAIDFLEYYAELALLPAPVLTAVSGERNDYRYLPLGPVVVIPPWNFPLAILAGMTSAALVAGNTVVLKPSSQSPVIAAKFVELAMEAGLPGGALSFLTGAGSSIGDFLVKDPRTRMIAFTGSKTVGLHINALAGRTFPGQKWIKRVIAEMGGKNAIVVDESADLEAAAQGAVASAFGYQGQKCSACSRLFVHQAVYEDFIARLVEKVSAIRQGPAEIYGNFMGPVISAGAMKTIQRYVALGMKEGRRLGPSPRSPGATALPLTICGTGALKESEEAPVSPRRGDLSTSPLPRGEVGRSPGEGNPGFFIPPAVFDRLPRSSRLWTEEVFGPVLAVDKVKTFAEGLERANAGDYGLTGAVYSQTAAHLEEARERFFCGNLYVNRKCTGAQVGGHPFGGFNLSGTDSKAGGPDYLALFTQAQCVSEKT